MSIRWSMAHHGVWIAILALGLTACGDLTGPGVYYDPAETLQRLDEVVDPLAADGDFLLGLDLAVATLDYYGASFLADVVSLGPRRHEGMARALRLRRSQHARPAGPGGVIGDPAAFTVPVEVRGRTLEWDPADGYVPGPGTQAPANGVRFLLYRMSDQTGYPRTPLSRIGYIEISDEDGRSSEALRVRALRTDGPDRLVADYRITLEGSGRYESGWLEVTTWGSLGGSGSVAVDLTETLEWSLAQNRDQLTLDYRYDRSTRSVQLEGLAIGPFEAMAWDIFDFDLWFRGGSATRIRAEIGAGGALDGEIREDGYRVIRIDGYDGEPRFLKEQGRLSPGDRAALRGVWTGITDLIGYTDWVVTPSDLLVLGG